jgi:type I restriction enzyme S subunit
LGGCAKVSETLLVLFKSNLMQNLLKQGCTGTILTAINKDEFYSLPVPMINEDIQNKIADLVQQSFALKAQSTHLLDVAKRAVEVAIEQDEAAAFAYIAKNAGR